MTWCVVKHEEALGLSFCLGFENVDGFVNLSAEILSTKISLPIFASLEYDPCLSVRLDE